MERVLFNELYNEFERILLKSGFSREGSASCARAFAENTRDGVQSHGIDRFPGFVDYVRRGLVDSKAEPARLGGTGAIERWDGRRGAGILNALFCMDRAVGLAAQHGIGCVGLRNTNHWMRAGTYGLRAADAGCAGMCWTNTTGIMPPWGSSDPRLGNNPLVICIPRKPCHLLLDMAMSQFSYGRMARDARQGNPLPVPGGFDEGGNLSDDPAAILRSRRPLPIGYWKGSGLAFMLDCLAAILAEGDATAQISGRSDETGLSQVFIAVSLSPGGEHAASLDRIIDDLHAAVAITDASPVTYPGEAMYERRLEHERNGIPVDEETWRAIRRL